MLSLIYNELYKLFHKKSTIVVLVITVLFAIFVNVIYNMDIDSFVNDTYYAYEVEDCKSRDITDDPYCKAILDADNLKKEFKDDAWQIEVINNKYIDYADNYYNDMSDEEYKKDYEEAKNALRNDDWKYFVKKDLESNLMQINWTKEELKNSNLKDSERLNYENMLACQEEEKSMLEYRLDKNVAYGNDYLNKAIENSSYYRSEVFWYEHSTTDKEKSEHVRGMKAYYENKYILDTMEDTNNEASLRAVLSNFFSEYSFLILVFVIMIAGGIVSDEFSKGTIKSLLIIPFKRTKILLAKFITVLIMLFLFITFIFIAQMIIGGFIFGFDSLSIPITAYNITTKSLEVVNIFKYFILTLVASLPQIILMMTLAFAVSIIFNSTALAITISFCGYIAANIINTFALAYDLKFLNYFVTTNWDFTEFLFGGFNSYGNSFIHATFICLIYFAIMMIISFIVFKKRDIKNI